MSQLKNNLEKAIDECSRLNKIATRILEHKPKITEFLRHILPLRLNG